MFKTAIWKQVAVFYFPGTDESHGGTGDLRLANGDLRF
jgi:hypothetical protein